MMALHLMSVLVTGSDIVIKIVNASNGRSHSSHIPERSGDKQTKYGIYEVEDEYDENGRWLGYRVAVATASTGRQGKLYIKSDGRENYQSPNRPKDEELDLI